MPCPTVGAVYQGVNELQGERISPPQQRRGGCAIKKKARSTIHRADGVVLIKFNEMNSLDQHHPGRSDKVLGTFSLCRCHPSSAEEGISHYPAIHSHHL